MRARSPFSVAAYVHGTPVVGLLADEDGADTQRRGDGSRGLPACHEQSAYAASDQV
ncbi:hypothetical protein [Streptomyces pratensis]|uniref:hypothetical protein n=1 Tax=Streptomyces pratensis TaxID=1169025 RepID=UPI003641EECF